MNQWYVSLVSRTNMEDEPVVRKIQARTITEAIIAFVNTIKYDPTSYIFLKDDGYKIKVEQQMEL